MNSFPAPLLAGRSGLGTQQLLIEFADLFERGFQGVIVFQALHFTCAACSLRRLICRMCPPG